MAKRYCFYVIERYNFCSNVTSWQPLFQQSNHLHTLSIIIIMHALAMRVANPTKWEKEIHPFPALNVTLLDCEKKKKEAHICSDSFSSNVSNLA